MKKKIISFFILLTAYISIICLVEYQDKINKETVINWEQIRYDLTGTSFENKQEVKAWVKNVSTSMKMPVLNLIRVSQTKDNSVLAKYSPLSHRIFLGPSFKNLSEIDKKIVIYHETAHAILIWEHMGAVFDGAQSEATREVLKTSILSHQMFHEHFSDLFAYMYMLRHGSESEKVLVLKQLRSLTRNEFSDSLIHDTRISQQLLNNQLSKSNLLNKISNNNLLARLQQLAAEGTIRTIASMHLENELVCTTGIYGILRYAQDGVAYQRIPLSTRLMGFNKTMNEYKDVLNEIKMWRVDWFNVWRASDWVAAEPLLKKAWLIKNYNGIKTATNFLKYQKEINQIELMKNLSDSEKEIVLKEMIDAWQYNQNTKESMRSIIANELYGMIAIFDQNKRNYCIGN